MAICCLGFLIADSMSQKASAQIWQTTSRDFESMQALRYLASCRMYVSGEVA